MASLEERIERAERGGPGDIKLLVHDPAPEVLEALLRNPFLSEEHLLLLLNRKDLPSELLQAVAENKQWVRSLRVKAALVRHPLTPRRISLRLMKFLYLFDLVTVILQPAVPPEIKRVAENQIIGRVEEVPVGQQVTLARRATARVVAALLQQGKEPVISAALENPLLTEAELLRVLLREDLQPGLVEQIARHPKWSRRYDVRLQLLRHPLTPLGLVLGFLPDLKAADLHLIVSDKRMPPTLSDYVKAEVKRRLERR